MNSFAIGGASSHIKTVQGKQNIMGKEEERQGKYFYLGCATLVGLALGTYVLVGGKRYNSIREVPLGDLTAELARRIR